ncbi:hypothetical protein HN873_005699 [Arachis hypogaea]|uniref:Pectinesterase n=1 Tax=Arachis hypogaea TaxID=3818 RepID=A0A445E6N5_ARAHY|nr:putative pectinesterase/pectinesterase inhibitor [Arachis hypogaea]RYR71136.1 hypothetical protein Ahy_A02g005433 [Arachis hypogaea]
MANFSILVFLLLLFTTNTFSLQQEIELLKMTQTQVSQIMNNLLGKLGNEAMLVVDDHSHQNYSSTSVALRDCANLYEESEYRLSYMMNSMNSSYYYYDNDDALSWVSALMTNQQTCLDGLKEKGYVGAHDEVLENGNLTMLLGQALDLYAKRKGKAKPKGAAERAFSRSSSNGGIMLASWNPSTSKADFIVSQDGSGTHRTIRDAVEALASRGSKNEERRIIYVRAGVYDEKVVIGPKLQNVMFVGDGMDRTIVTGSRSAADGSSTLGSATFDISGDGFWARDMTFENTAAPRKHQAVALKSGSDFSVFYRCRFRGYQDTLYVYANRQFYRDCQIYGTIDFIFGDATVVIQNSDIYVRKPMSSQSNYITAQGRENPKKPTGISIINCKVRPTSDFVTSESSIKTFLGRPWKKYSRTVVMKSDLDGLIDPKGWGPWDGEFAIRTLYYGEYMNYGSGASLRNRVNWPGFHVLNSANEAYPFSVGEFLQGARWIPASGVPFSSGI